MIEELPYPKRNETPSNPKNFNLRYHPTNSVISLYFKQGMFSQWIQTAKQSASQFLTTAGDVLQTVYLFGTDHT